MQTATLTPPVPRLALRAGQVIGGLAVLFLLFDGGIHIAKIPPVVEAFRQLGYPVSASVPLGIIEVTGVLLYVLRRTSLLGAVLLTGYLGGAVAIHLRIGSPVFSHLLFPVYVGAMLWVALYLRDERLRALLSARS
jgi:hypothetical protein